MAATFYVSMERYWTTVAVPMFFLILGFGIWVLFNFSPTQITSQSLFGSVARIVGPMKPVDAAAAQRPAPVNKQTN